MAISDGEHSSITVADGNAADDKVMWKQLKMLNDIVFYIELLEYSGNVIGTVAFLWATVVMLGGFCSLLSRLDFWFATVMVFMEGTRVFISKDTSVNQWLFGSTSAFRWDHFCFSDKYSRVGNIIAVIIGAGISLAPIGSGRTEIITGILKVAILAITSQLLARRRWSGFAIAVISLFVLAGVCGAFYGFWKIAPHTFSFRFTRARALANAKFFGKLIGWVMGTFVGAFVVLVIIVSVVERFGRGGLYWAKVIVASALVCLPVLQAKLGSKHRYLSISIAAALLSVNSASISEEDNISSSPPKQEQSSNALVLRTRDLLSKIFDTIMPILFFWGVMFPLPGISLKVSFYMLLSVVAAELVGNLQIPVAFLQILLSSLRLHSLLAGRDYHPLPDGASPNLVPSIAVFFVLELCQGSSNVLGVILGLMSFAHRRLLVRDLELKEEWVAQAVNLYHHQACMTLKEKGLFHMEKSTTPSLDSFAVESLGCTSSEMQIVRLRVLDYYLQHGDSKSRSKLMAQIAKDAAGIVTKITVTISHLITDEESGDTDTVQQIRSPLSLSLNFVSRLAAAGGKMGTRFRQELSGNPILLHNLQRVLDLAEYKQELWVPAMGVLKWLALHDEATAKENGSTHAVIPKLKAVFLNTSDDGRSLRQAAGEVLAHLTITTSDNCRTILEGPGRHDLIKNLIGMLQDDDNNYVSVAANLLHNLYVNSGDMLIDLDLDLDAKEGLKSALRTVMKIIIGNENDEKQSENSGNEEVKRLMDAALLTSQIGYVMPKEDFAHVLAENLTTSTGAAAKKLVGKLVDTLKSNREPNREFPRLRRVLIETVISIVEASPGYIEIFREKGAENALNMLIGTSSRLEKYKVFIDEEGMVLESSPMHEVVDKAKRLMMVSNKSNQPSDHGL